MIPEKADFYIIKHYLEADGENMFGPDIYLVKTSCRETAIRIANMYFPGEIARLRIYPVRLPIETPLWIGTMIRTDCDIIELNVDKRKGFQ